MTIHVKGCLCTTCAKVEVPKFTFMHSNDSRNAQFLWIENTDDFEKMHVDQLARDNSVKFSLSQVKNIERIAKRISDRLTYGHDTTEHNKSFGFRLKEETQAERKLFLGS